MIVDAEETKANVSERRTAAATSDQRRRAAMEEEAASEERSSESDLQILNEEVDKNRKKRNGGKPSESSGVGTKGSRAKPKVRKCSMCKKVAKTYVSCQSCNKNFHFECANLKDRKHKPKSYTCNACKNKRRKQKRIEKTQMEQPRVRRTEENKRRFAEFARKHPEYVESGRVVFPIDDRLLLAYNELFSDGKPRPMKPTARKGLVPSNVLGDVLQVWNFCSDFHELLKLERFSRAELYAALAYAGDEPLSLLDNVFAALTRLLFEEVRTRPKYEKEIAGHDFFALARIIEPEIFAKVAISVYPDILKNISRLTHFSNNFTSATMKSINAMQSATNPAKLDIREKNRILLALIECVHETDVFHEFYAARLENYNLLLKEKGELQQSIKEAEAEYYENKAKLELLDSLKEKSSASRGETLKVIRDIEKNQAALAKAEANLLRDREKLDEVLREVPFYINSAQFIGFDANRWEYWVFSAENEVLFVRAVPANSVLADSEDNWYFYDRREDVDALLAALSAKGIREKALFESLQNALRNGILYMEPSVVPSKANGDGRRTSSSRKAKDEGSLSLNVDDDRMEIEPTPVPQQETLAEITARLIARSPPAWANLSMLKTRFVELEGRFTDYLRRRECRWAPLPERERFVQEILDATKVTELRALLVGFNETISSVEARTDEEEKGVTAESARRKRKLIIQDSDEEEANNEEQAPEEADRADESVRRVALKVWGLFNDRLRRTWSSYAESVETPRALFLALTIFEDNLHGYMARGSGDRSGFKNRGPGRPRVLRDEEASPPEREKEMVIENRYLEPLVRRSERTRTKVVHIPVKHVGISSNRETKPSQMCVECEESGSGLVKCDTCGDRYHLECAGLKERPVGGWNCKGCWEDAAIKRHTRSLTRKFGL